MRRLASKTVLRGFMAAWFFAASPIRRSSEENATYEGVVLFPSARQNQTYAWPYRTRLTVIGNDFYPIILPDTNTTKCTRSG